MKYFLTVNEVETIEQLLHHLLYLAEAEFDVNVGKESGKVVLAEIEDKVKGGFVTVVLASSGPTDLDQVDDVLMSKKL